MAATDDSLQNILPNTPTTPTKNDLTNTDELDIVNQQIISLRHQATVSNQYAASIVANFRKPLLVLDKQLRIKTANTAFYNMFQVNETDTEATFIYDLGNHQWNIPELRKHLDDVLVEHTNFKEFKVSHNFPTIGERVMLLNARAMTTDIDQEKLILLTIEDITEQTNHQLKESELLYRFQTLVAQAPVAICVLRGEDYIIEVINKEMAEMWHKKEADVINKPTFEVLPELVEQGIKKLLDDVIKTGNRFVAQELPITLDRNGNPEDIFVKFVYEPIFEADGTISGVMALAHDITEQVITRKRIQNNEKKYYNMLMQSPFAFSIMKGKDMVVTLANDLMKEFWGKGNDVENKPLLQILPELESQPFPAMLDQVFTTGIPVNANEILAKLTHSGIIEDHYFNVVYQPLIEKDDIVSGVITIAYEVTEIVLARKKMEAQAVMVKELIRTAPGFVCTLIGPTHVYDLINESYQQFFGKRKIQGKALLDALPELAGQGFDILLDKVYQTGETYVGVDIPITMARDEGLLPEQQYFNFSYQPMYNEYSEIYAILVFGYEVTEQVIAKNKNLETKEIWAQELEEKVQQRTLELSVANESLQQKNAEIALSKYNKRFLYEFSEKFSSYKSNNEFFTSLVQYISDLTHLDYVLVGKILPNGSDTFTIKTLAITAFGTITDNILYPLADGPCLAVIRGEVYSFPEKCCTIFPKNETIANFKVEGYIGYPLYDVLGNAIGLIAVMHRKIIEDEETVTAILKIVAKRAEVEMERLRYEEQLEKNNKSLEEKNKELSFEIAENEKRSAELVIANKELAFQSNEKEKKAAELVLANRELESFAYVSSHDLQEPLRKIQTFAARILEKEYVNLSDTGKDYFHRMQNAAKRMQTLIEDLLTYSHTNVSERKFEQTDLNKIVADVENELMETILEKNAVIEVGKLCQLSINKSQFRQVIYNLISNALKFSKLDTPLRITIYCNIALGSQFQNQNPKFGLDRFKADQKYCHIAFSDNGIGFDPEYTHKIFELFQRLHGKEAYAGTGIGLAIVKKIIDNHNGIITASGELNKGAKFDIYIPLSLA